MLEKEAAIRKSSIEPRINLVFCINENFAKYASVTIASIIANSTEIDNCDFFILSIDDLSDFTQRLLRQQLQKTKALMHFINVRKHINTSNLFVHWEWSEDIFTRLLIPEILQNNEKVIYSDADIIFEVDICLLNKIHLGQYALGAVRDWVVKWRTINTPTLEIEGAHFEIEKYMNEIGIVDLGNYFNSGLMLMDIKKLKEIQFSIRAKKVMESRRYLYPDQDIINSLLVNDILPLDPRWNIYAGSIKTIPKSCFEAHYVSQNVDWKSPYAIHFLGGMKPWRSSYAFFCERFWHYAQISPYFEILKVERERY